MTEKILTPWTSEAIEQNTSPFDRLLAHLESSAATTTNTVEKAQNIDIMGRLKAMMSSRQGLESGKIDTTRANADLLAEFRKTLSPEKVAFFDRMQKQAELWTKGVAQKVNENVPVAIAEVQKVGSEVVDAAKSGDIAKVKALANGAREMVDAQGQKFLEFTGAAAL